MRYLFLAIGVCIVACTKSPQQMAERSVTDYLKDNVNDPSSYQSISFAAIDSVYSSSYYTHQHNALSDSIDNIFFVQSLIIDNMQSLPKNPSIFYGGYGMLVMNEYQETLDSFYKVIDTYRLAQDSIHKAYKPSHMGYSIAHRYRTKNESGALVLIQDTFSMDMNYKIFDNWQSLQDSSIENN